MMSSLSNLLWSEVWKLLRSMKPSSAMWFASLAELPVTQSSCTWKESSVSTAIWLNSMLQFFLIVDDFMPFVISYRRRLRGMSDGVRRTGFRYCDIYGPEIWTSTVKWVWLVEGVSAEKEKAGDYGYFVVHVVRLCLNAYSKGRQHHVSVRHNTH